LSPKTKKCNKDCDRVGDNVQETRDIPVAHPLPWSADGCSAAK